MTPWSLVTHQDVPASSLTPDGAAQPLAVLDLVGVWRQQVIVCICARQTNDIRNFEINSVLEILQTFSNLFLSGTLNLFVSDGWHIEAPIAYSRVLMHVLLSYACTKRQTRSYLTLLDHYSVIKIRQPRWSSRFISDSPLKHYRCVRNDPHQRRDPPRQVNIIILFLSELFASFIYM